MIRCGDELDRLARRFGLGDQGLDFSVAGPKAGVELLDRARNSLLEITSAARQPEAAARISVWAAP